MILEICAQSYQAALNAEAGGAQRIELCTHLGGGGITPSLGLINQVLKEIHIPVFVLIRPRPGNFMYNSGEIEIMVKDIQYSVEVGVQGIVSGCLTQSDELDLTDLKQLLKAAQGLPFTFHRAFEQINNQDLALRQLMDLGITRILTGGSTGNAYQSRLELKQLQIKAGNRLTILAGSGVNPSNVEQLIKEGSIREVHSSAKYTSPNIPYPIDPMDSDPEIVKELAAICQRS